MRFTVYRALGRESSWFGISESYMRHFLLGAAFSLAVSLAVGSSTVQAVGFVLLAALLCADYFGILYVQSRWSVKDLTRVLASLRLPRRVAVKPVRLDVFVARWNPSGTVTETRR